MRSISNSSVSLSRPRLEDRVLGGSGNVAWSMLLCSALLSVVGAATIHSASSELAIDYLPRQMVWLALGLAAFVLGILLDYRFLFRIAPQIYIGSLVFVGVVTFVGHEAGGARSWVGLAGLGGQPSDLMKISACLLLARYLAGIRQPHLSTRQILIATTIVAIPMGLLMLQPDLGGAAMFLPMLIGMTLVAGLRMRFIVVTGLIVAVAFAGLWTFGMRDYQKDRILSFVSPERDPLGAGYQLRQSKIAVGSGELLGKGYMQGTQSQLRFLPARHTDFVFAVLAEERGFLGVLVVLLLYALFFTNAARSAFRARNRGGILLVTGLSCALGGYVLYNTAMLIGLLPVTGIPLPFLSYGGSFILFAFFSSGLIAGVDLRRYVNR